MADENDIPTLDPLVLEEELRKEQAYGERPGEAFAGQALSTATFGLSDAALVAAGVEPERLREVREREAEAALAGAVTGAVAPAIATLGTSAAAQAAAIPARAAIAAGGAAEAIAAKALPAGVAKTVGAAVARGAAEGALAGTGELISDVALEKRDLSAESIMGTIGTGTLYGAGFGAILGTSEAAINPAIKVAKTTGIKLKGITGQAFKRVTDPVEGALDALAGNTSQKLKLKARLGSNIDDLPNFIVKDLELGYGNTPSDLAEKNFALYKRSGKTIEKLSSQIDDIAKTKVLPPRGNIFSRLNDKANQILDDIGPGASSSIAKQRVVEAYKRDFAKLAKKPEELSFKELDSLRRQYAKDAYRGDDPVLSFKGDVAEDLRAELRNIVDEIATNVNPDLAARLKVANKQFHMAATIKHPLEYLAEKSPDLAGGLTAFIASVAGRGVRNAALIHDVAGRTASVVETVKSGIATALTPKAAKGSMTFPATSILVKSELSTDSEGNRPKNKKQAFENVAKNISETAADPEKMIDLLAKKTSVIAQASPEVGMVLQQKLTTAVNFLNSKLPKPAISAGMFQREWQPSSMELAKFERYVQIVEQPLTALDELKKGTLTREHVEALQAVYPEIYKEIQLQVMDKITEGKVKLPYAKKLQIGILLNVPADSSLQPETLLQLQQNLAATSEQPQEGPQFRASSMEQTGISERMQSGTEALSTRE